jgi:hypothetical protein
MGRRIFRKFARDHCAVEAKQFWRCPASAECRQEQNLWSLATPVAAKPDGLIAQAPYQLPGLHREVALPSVPKRFEFY